MRSRLILVLLGLISMLMATSVILAGSASSPAFQQAEPTLDPFPRPNDVEIIVAEQVFEGGRMFYLDPVQRIWVMIDADVDDAEDSGEWLVFEDTWQEGEPESDPSIVAPDGLHQPIRGFGKIWRENPDIREALGWGLDPEIGHLTRYRFFEGEMVEGDDGEMMQEPGIHTLRSFYSRIFLFNEAQGTWSVIRPPEPRAETDASGDMDAEMTPEAEMTAEPEMTAEASE